MYVEAEEAFGRAAPAPDKCAMAHWGLAMAYFQPFWGDADLEGDRLHAERAAELEAPTEWERAYADAALAFFRPADSAYPDRVRRWESATEELHREVPDDQEAAAFYALAHLSVAPYEPGHQERAQAIVDEF